MKYYILILDDQNKNYCGGSNLPELSTNILNCITNGFVQIIPYVYIFKSMQNVKYWQELILPKIDQKRNSFYINEIDLTNNGGWLGKNIWDWIRTDKAEIEKTLCKNTFEVESCT